MAGTIERPRNARSERTRAALLLSARELVEEEGAEALTLTAVAERAGVSPRALYLHFRSRSDLFVALYRHLVESEQLAKSLERVWAAPDSVSAVQEWARHLGRTHPRILGVSIAMDAARRSDPAAAEYWHQVVSGWRGGCRRLAEWLAADGKLAEPWTPASAADMMWALMSWDVLERLTVEARWSRAKYVEHMKQLLRRTFVA